jgi:RNA polymerase sigma-70 factor (ECF subfamily)
MGSSSDSQTSPSLLGRLCRDPTDQAAWAEFVDRYGRKIYAWSRQWDLQDADAQDVTQAVLVRLAQRLPTFAYDRSRSFRGWLRTLTQHALSDFLKGRARAARGGGGGQGETGLESLEARESLLAALEGEFDREVLEQATARVRLRVEPRTWEAFRLTAVEGLPGAEAGRRLQMRVAAVFKAKSRVQKLLQEAIAELEGDAP